MKTKKIIPAILICIFSFSFSAINAKDIEVTTTTLDENKNDSKIAASLLISRLHEIQGMTKRNLSASEKSELKQEVKQIKKELTKMQGGLFISGGLLLLILILIIIL